MNSDSEISNVDDGGSYIQTIGTDGDSYTHTVGTDAESNAQTDTQTYTQTDTSFYSEEVSFIRYDTTNMHFPLLFYCSDNKLPVLAFAVAR